MRFTIQLCGPVRWRFLSKKPKAAIVAAPKPKKPADKKAAPKKPVKEKTDDDEEGGTYAYMKEEQVADEDKPAIEYAPDMSIKDLRGPAASRWSAPPTG